MIHFIVLCCSMMFQNIMSASYEKFHHEKVTVNYTESYNSILNKHVIYITWQRQLVLWKKKIKSVPMSMTYRPTSTSKEKHNNSTTLEEDIQVERIDDLPESCLDYYLQPTPTLPIAMPCVFGPSIKPTKTHIEA